jgi:hypothetical protein
MSPAMATLPSPDRWLGKPWEVAWWVLTFFLSFFLLFKGQSLLVVAPVMEAFFTTVDNAPSVLKSDSDRPFELVEG